MSWPVPPQRSHRTRHWQPRFGVSRRPRSSAAPSDAPSGDRLELRTPGTARERTLFRRLAVFVGGFTIEAAETVCARDDCGSDEVLTLLAALVNRSDVVATDNGAERRYRLLEVVRQYAEEALVESEEETPYGHGMPCGA